jgi:hypothetical protein
VCCEDGSQGLLAPTRVGLPRMLTNVALARPSLRHPPGCLEPSWRKALDGPQDEPGDRRAEIALQRDWNDRRVPSKRPVGDKPPMNSQAPSAPISSLHIENAEGQRSRWLVRIYFADLRASLACATTLRRGVTPTEYLYVKLSCPSVFTSY